MHSKWLDYLSKTVVFLGGIALVVLVAITGWQVWGRYILNDTPTWAERLSLLLILIVSLPLAAIGLRENFHISINALTDRLPESWRQRLELFNTFVLLGFGAAMAWYSWILVDGTWNRKIPLLGVPQGVQYLPLVVCGVLIVVFMLERLWGQLREAK
ncbi:MAG: TRAP transporter small permease [Thiolinea sp.]